MFCPTCGKKQPENAKFCFSCGRKIDIPIQEDDRLPENIASASTDKTCIETVMNEVQVVSEEPPVLQMNEEENKEERRIGEEVKCPHCGLWQKRDRVICFRCGKSLDGAPLMDKKIEKSDDKTGIDRKSTHRIPTSVNENRDNNSDTDIDSTNVKEEQNNHGDVSMSETNKETTNVGNTYGEWISCPYCGLWQMKNRTTCYRCGKDIRIKSQKAIEEKQNKQEQVVDLSYKVELEPVEIIKGIHDEEKEKSTNILFNAEDLSVSELVTCPICGRRKVARSAVSCPECGYGISEHFEKEKREQEERQSIEIPEKPSYPIMAILIGLVFLLWSAANVIVIATTEDSGINGVGAFFAIVFLVIGIACFYSGNKIYKE